MFSTNKPKLTVTENTKNSNNAKIIKNLIKILVLTILNLAYPLFFRLMETTEKWKCSICTYKNYPATKRCAICYTEKISSEVVEIDENEKLKSSVENEVEISLEKCSLKSETKNTTRVRNACSTSSSKKVTEAENNDSVEDEAVKWQCKICTFLNYPKSAKCSMCGEMKALDQNPENSTDSKNLKKSPEKTSFKQAKSSSSENSDDENSKIQTKYHKNKRNSKEFNSPPLELTTNTSTPSEHSEFIHICREIIKGSNTSFLQNLPLSSELLFKTIPSSIQQTELKLKPVILTSQPAQNNQLTIMHLAMFYRRKEFLKRLTKFLSNQVTTDFSPLPNTVNFVQMMRTHIYGQFRMVKSKFAQGYIDNNYRVEVNVDSLAEIRRQIIPAQGL